MAVMRAGVTHWHAGLIEAGHGLICKAYAILLITHGPSHPITKDLEVGVISVWARLQSSHRKNTRKCWLLLTSAVVLSRL